MTARLKEILEKPEVTSIAGNDVFETAALVAREIRTKHETVSKVVIAPVDSFVEAIAATPLAAAKGWPILLARENGDLPRITRNLIVDLEIDAALGGGYHHGTEPGLCGSAKRGGWLRNSRPHCRVRSVSRLRVHPYGHSDRRFFPGRTGYRPCLAADNGMLLLATNGHLTPEMLSLEKTERPSVRSISSPCRSSRKNWPSQAAARPARPPVPPAGSSALLA